MYYVYALKSLKTNELYIGLSRDPEKRLKEHNAGCTPSTYNKRPYVLIYQETADNRKQAREQEKKLKSGSGREYLKQFIPR